MPDTASNVTITFQLVPGSVVQDATALGQQAATAFQEAFKPNLAAAGAAAAGTAAGGVGPAGLTAGGAIPGLNQRDLGESIGKSLGLALSGAIGKSFSDELRGHFTAQRTEAAARPRARPEGAVERAGGEALEVGATVDRAVRTLEVVARGFELAQAISSGGSLTTAAGFTLPRIQGILQSMARRGEIGERPEERRGGEGVELRTAVQAAQIARATGGAERPAAGAETGAVEEGGEAAAGAAAGGEGGGLLSSLTGGGVASFAGRLLGPVAVGLAAIGTTKAIGEVAERLTHLSERAAETSLNWSNMAKTMGLSTEEFVKLRTEFAKSGIDVDEFGRATMRMAIALQRDMPDAQKEYADGADQMAEANIKLADTGRDVEKAQLAQQDTTLTLTKAREQLEEQEQTGDEQRRERLRGVQLGVSQAGIGAEQAEQGEARAGINVRFAPREEQIQAIQGPLTSEGARLGVEQAQIALQRFQGQNTQAAERDLQARTLAHNLQEAKLRVDQADLAEERTKEERAEGVGPVGQAALQQEQADQAQKEAALREQTAQTALKTEQIRQQFVTQQMETAQAQRQVRGAELGVEAAPGVVTGAEVVQRRAEREFPFERAAIPTELERGERQLQAGQRPDVDFRLATPEALRTLFAVQSGGTVPGAFSAIGQYLRTVVPTFPEEQREQRGEAAVAALPGLSIRQLGGPAVLPRLVQLLSQTPEQREAQLTPEDKELYERTAQQIQQNIRPATALVEQQSVQAESQRQRLVTAGLQGIPAAEKFLDVEEQGEKLSAAVQETSEKVASGITEGGDAIAEALQSVAGKISGLAGGLGGDLFAPRAAPAAPPAEAPPAAAPPAEAPPAAAPPAGGQQTGGLISGSGSETSDSIPIMASNGEYIVKASTVKSVGVPFLDALNAKRFGEGGFLGLRGFAEGGVVESTSESQRLNREQYATFENIFGFPVPVATWNELIRAHVDVRNAFDQDGKLTDRAKQALGAHHEEAQAKATEEAKKEPEEKPEWTKHVPEFKLPKLEPSVKLTLPDQYKQPTTPTTTLPEVGVTAPRIPDVTVFRGSRPAQTVGGDQAATGTAGGVTVFRGSRPAQTVSPTQTTDQQTGSVTVFRGSRPAQTVSYYKPTEANTTPQAATTATTAPEGEPLAATPTEEDVSAAGFAEGGVIPTNVSNGEYRVSAAATAHYGPAFMDLLNSGAVKPTNRQLGGGLFSGAATAASLGIPRFPPQLNVSPSQAWAGFPASTYGLSVPSTGGALASLGVNPANFKTPALNAGQTAQLGRIGGALGSALGSIDLGVGGGTNLPTGAIGGATEGFSLNLMTSGGNFKVNVGSDTMAAIQNSSIGAQLSSAGSRPSWYS